MIGRQRMLSFSINKNPVCNFHRIRAAYPDDSDSPFGKSRGNGGYRIILHLFSLRQKKFGKARLQSGLS